MLLPSSQMVVDIIFLNLKTGYACIAALELWILSEIVRMHELHLIARCTLDFKRLDIGNGVRIESASVHVLGRSARYSAAAFGVCAAVTIGAP